MNRIGPAETVSLRNIKRTSQVITFILLLVVLTLSAGCINSSEEISTTDIVIPDDIKSDLTECIADIEILHQAISSDITYLAEDLGNAQSVEERGKLAYKYYADNSWVDKLIYYDAKTDQCIEIPVPISSRDKSYIPQPTEEEFAHAGEKHTLYYDDIYLPDEGHVIIHCSATYDQNDTYCGYVTLIYDLFLTLNYHPLTIGNEKEYDDCIATIIDRNGTIICSSRQEIIGETIGDSFYRGVSLIKRSDLPSGAYSYESPAFYTYARDNITKKITAWTVFSVFDTPYTLYLTKEYDKPPLQTENIYEVTTGEVEAAVNDAYTFAAKYGNTELYKRINSGYYQVPLYVLNYNGTVIAGPNKDIGLSYLNNHGAYGYKYAQYMISTAKQGGGYVYYLYPVDDTINSPAAQFSLGYLLPLEEDSLVFGYSSADKDLIIKNKEIRNAVNAVSSEVLREYLDHGIDYVINKINNHPPRNTSQFVSGFETNVEDLGIIGFDGKIYASLYNKSVVGYSLTGYRDAYGGSTVRKLIMLSRLGGGYADELYACPDEEGYLNLWIYSIEPINDSYIIYTGAVLKRIKEISPDLSGFEIYA